MDLQILSRPDFFSICLNEKFKSRQSGFGLQFPVYLTDLFFDMLQTTYYFR